MRFVIVGGGINGAAAAFQLSELLKAGSMAASITLLERGKRGQPTGSSAGITRITRKASFENPHVIPGMVELSNAILLELGAVTPIETVLVGNNPRYLDNAVAAATLSNARFSHLDEPSLQRYPYLNMDGLSGVVEDAMDEHGNGAGTLDPTLAISRMLEKAVANGAVVRFDTEVSSITEDAQGVVRLKTTDGEIIEADRVITAAGVWSDRLIGRSSAGSLYTKPKVLKVFWFKLDAGYGRAHFPNILFKLKGGPYLASLHPGFATKHAEYDFSNPATEEGVYMIQENLSDGAYLKFGHIQPVPQIKEDPDLIAKREQISKEHEAFVAHFVREFMPGVAHALPDLAQGRAAFTQTYLEGFASDFMPVIGPRFAESHITVMAGFSGIGAKFAVASGRYAALYALGRSEEIPANVRELFAPQRMTLRFKPPGQWRINGNLGAPGPDGTVQSPPCLDMGLLGEKATALYRNGYPANPGIPEARQAVANMFNRYLSARQMPGEPIDRNSVLIATGGATDAAQIAIDHAKAKFGDAARPVAVLLTPVYHLYIGQLAQSGFDVQYIDGVDRYDARDHSFDALTDEEYLWAIRGAITPETCLLFINSPRNPDGKIFSREFLIGVLAILDDHPQLRLISDTIYKEVAPAEANAATLFGLANRQQRTRIYETDGTSKSVAKTMDRAAWVISDATNVEEISLVSHLKRGRPALPQMLQIVSMDEYLEINASGYFEKNSALYLAKLGYVATAAAQVHGLRCSPYVGAYYGYLDFRGVDFGAPMSALEKEIALVDALIAKGVAVSPGTNFKHPGAIRFNASFDNRTLELLMDILVETFAELGARVSRHALPLPAINSPDYQFQPYPVGVMSAQRP